ncbi:MAG: alpha/beta hydrolase [Thermoanaerobaculia bacterium]
MRERRGVPPRSTTSISVPLQLFPRLPHVPPPFPLLLGLHGYGMHAATLFPLLSRMAPEGWGVVALEGPQSAFLPGEELGPSGARGFHWGVSPRHEDNQAVHRAAVAEAIAWSVARGADPARVSLLGFSQPCSFDYRLALAPPHGHPFRAVVGLCGGLPGEWTEPGPGTAASSATHALHVSTDVDEYYALERVAPFEGLLAPRFASARHEIHHGGHRIPATAIPVAKAFLEAHG